MTLRFELLRRREKTEQRAADEFVFGVSELTRPKRVDREDRAGRVEVKYREGMSAYRAR